jgi:hypothetical protein
MGHGVENLVKHYTLFDRTPAHYPLTNVAAFLQETYRRSTVRKRNGKDACMVEYFEPVAGQSTYGGRGNPFPPEGFAKPVTDLRRTAFDIAS